MSIHPPQPEPLELPAPSLIRSRIEAVRDPQMKPFLMASYLLATRSIELCGIAKKGELCYGPRGTDVATEHYRDPITGVEADIGVFTLRTAKRKGFIRKVGLPLDPRYEPWTSDLVNYWQSKGSELVFPFNRGQAEWFVVHRNIFEGISYPITAYDVKISEELDQDGKKKGVYEDVEEHPRQMVLHGLRHVRSSELLNDYDFTMEQVSAYGGWTIKSEGRQVSNVLAKHYLKLSYRKYIGKLLRPYQQQQGSTTMPSSPIIAAPPLEALPKPIPEIAQMSQSSTELMEALTKIEKLQKRNKALISLLQRVKEIDPTIIDAIQQQGKRKTVEKIKLTYNAF